MSMSRWTHAICQPCWRERYGVTRNVVVVRDDEERSCCFCGAATAAGIYVRADPATLACRGEH
jgi:hypothetical protein